MNEFYFQIAKKYQQYWVKHIISQLKETNQFEPEDIATLKNSYLENWLVDFKSNVNQKKLTHDLIFECNTITTYNQLFHKVTLRIVQLKQKNIQDKVLNEYQNLKEISKIIVSSLDHIQCNVLRKKNLSYN